MKVGLGERSEINRQRIPKTRGGITEGTIKEYKLEGAGWKGVDSGVRRRRFFTSRFDNNKITQIGLLRLVEKIMSTRYDFVLYAFCDPEPVKRCECG